MNKPLEGPAGSRTREGVLAAEQRRTAALVASDLETLRDILAPELTHTHTRGLTDDLVSFLHFVEHDIAFLKIERGALTVKMFGDVAVMSGTSANLVKPRGKEAILSRSQVLQVWHWRNARWVMEAFQSTTLPALAEDAFSSYVRR